MISYRDCLLGLELDGGDDLVQGLLAASHHLLDTPLLAASHHLLDTPLLAASHHPLHTPLLAAAPALVGGRGLHPLGVRLLLLLRLLCQCQSGLPLILHSLAIIFLLFVILLLLLP